MVWGQASTTTDAKAGGEAPSARRGPLLLGLESLQDL